MDCDFHLYNTMDRIGYLPNVCAGRHIDARNRGVPADQLGALRRAISLLLRVLGMLEYVETEQWW